MFNSRGSSLSKLNLKLAAVVALLLPAVSAAQWHDNWQGKDKREHIKGSAAMAGVGALITDSDAWVFGGCMAVGVAWELRNRRLVGQPVSWKDLVADAAGCGLGLGAARVGLKIVDGKPLLTYMMELK